MTGRLARLFKILCLLSVGMSSDEVAVGAKSLRQLGRSVGDMVTATGQKINLKDLQQRPPKGK